MVSEVVGVISPSTLWVGSMTLEYVNYVMWAPRTNSFTMHTFLLNLEIRAEVYPYYTPTELVVITHRDLKGVTRESRRNNVQLRIRSTIFIEDRICKIVHII